MRADSTHWIVVRRLPTGTTIQVSAPLTVSGATFAMHSLKKRTPEGVFLLVLKR